MRGRFGQPQHPGATHCAGQTKIKAARIPYEIPERSQLPGRLGQVLQVIYLLYNEGYKSTEGAGLMRPELAAQTISLGQSLWALLPEPEVGGLLSLMQLQEARAASRQDAAGALVRLEDQERALWDRAAITEASARLQACLSRAPAGPYCLQAAIAACHAEAASFAATPGRKSPAYTTPSGSANPAQ